jgi:hypothetical protein
VQVAQLVSLAATAALVWIIGRFVWDLTDGDVLLTFAAAIDVLLVSVFTTFWTCRIIIDPLHFALAVAGFYCLTKPGLATVARQRSSRLSRSPFVAEPSPGCSGRPGACSTPSR